MTASLITPENALALTLQNATPLTETKAYLSGALNRVLARTVQAPINHPIFDQSAVDGYALRFADLQDHKSLTLTDQIKAGDEGSHPLVPGTCARIYTGAPLPPGADTIVMQEHTTRTGEQIQVHDPGLKQGGNVRRAGEQILAGETALEKGTRLTPAAIGFLASLGIQEVSVHLQPRVHIIVTGDEFAQGEADFRRGKIFESNGQMLVAALKSRGIEAQFTTCRDNPEALATMVRTHTSTCDLLIMTGGVSVGDFDFSRGALETNHFIPIYHQVAQKPGKPLLFCSREPKAEQTDDLPLAPCPLPLTRQAAFGLPGNPRAVLTCFYRYVLPYLDALEGITNPGLTAISLPLAETYRRKPDGKTHFVTGILQGSTVRILDGQQSHMLQTFAQAHCLVTLPPEPALFEKGTLLECMIL
jgi:molybdopterin molybdotransferase